MACPGYDKTERVKRAAVCGNAKAQYQLGWWSLFDNDGQPDIEKGIFWLGKSAEQGDMEARKLLNKIQKHNSLSKKVYTKPIFGASHLR